MFYKLYEYILIFFIITAIKFKIITTLQTEHYILEREYPLERHRIQTEDGYILTVHRIPHSPEHQYSPHTIHHAFSPHSSSSVPSRKPVVLLQHGFGLSSEGWVLPDREIGLAYQLADAGFDVWLNNQRGNSYSRQHTQYDVDVNRNDFWNFSFHEIGYYDLAAVFDYMLAKTNNTAVHFVGYSQGTTCMLVLLASRPEYRAKVKTTHLLAPVAVMKNLKVPFLQRTSERGLRFGEKVMNFLGHIGVMRYHHLPFYRTLCNWVCGEGSRFENMCRMAFIYFGGPGMSNIKQSILSDVCAAQPAGASIKQILHFVQVYVKGKFQQYDYGSRQHNELHYKQSTPPAYDISSITNCVHLYYGVTDHLADAEDVQALAKSLPCAVVQPISDGDDKWNHYDFLWSKDAKQLINERIIQVVRESESK
ncbi:lipase 3-like [Musca autumnalis]|uniref:lipase 3-like n=1 Tax=Musca autumnalis TaxID=221902 RepID=UPI003CF644C7